MSAEPRTLSPRSTTRGAFLALAISVASLASLQNLVIPVIPVIQRDLGISADAAAWTMTAWLVAAAVATPLLGRTGDLIGRRRVFLAVLAVVSLGDIVAAIAPDLTVLLAGRVLQGAGGALFPLAFGMLREVMPAARVSGAIGAMSAVIGIGGGLGTVAAGPLSEALGWRGLFLAPLVLGAIGAAMTVVLVPARAERAPGRINVLSATLLSGWLVALLLPLSSGPRWGWTSWPVIALFAAAAVLLAAWVVAELRSDEPLVDIRMLLTRAVWPVNLASLLLGAAMFGFWGYLPQFLQTPTATGYGLGADVRETGLLLLPMLAAMSAAGFAAGALGRVLSLRTQLGAGASVMALAVVATALFHQTTLEVAIAAGVFGAGLGVAYAATASLVVQAVPASHTGVATGMNANLRTVGSAIGSATVSAIVFGSVDAAGHPLESGYVTAFELIAALAVATAVIVLTVRTTSRASRRPERARSAERAGQSSLESVDEAFVA